MTPESKKTYCNQKNLLFFPIATGSKKIPLHQLNSYFLSIIIHLLFLKDKFTVTTLPSYQDSGVMLAKNPPSCDAAGRSPGKEPLVAIPERCRGAAHTYLIASFG